MDEHSQRLHAALEANGMLLQHDKTLPSASAVIAGEPVAGSWWSHPMAHPIFDALNDLEDEGLTLTCKLVAGKLTLVDRRLWPDLLAVATERAAWQTAQLSDPAARLLEEIEDVSEPTIVDSSRRDAGKVLEATLLADAREVHLPSGRHAKALAPWSLTATERGIAVGDDPGYSRAVFETIVNEWSPTRRLLPWS